MAHFLNFFCAISAICQIAENAFARIFHFAGRPQKPGPGADRSRGDLGLGLEHGIFRGDDVLPVVMGWRAQGSPVAKTSPREPSRRAWYGDGSDRTQGSEAGIRPNRHQNINRPCRAYRACRAWRPSPVRAPVGVAGSFETTSLRQRADAFVLHVQVSQVSVVPCVVLLWSR